MALWAFTQDDKKKVPNAGSKVIKGKNLVSLYLLLHYKLVAGHKI